MNNYLQPSILVSIQPGTGGGQVCCKQMISPIFIKIKKKSLEKIIEK